MALNLGQKDWSMARVWAGSSGRRQRLKAPGPPLPAEIIQRTSEKYREALARLTAGA